MKNVKTLLTATLLAFSTISYANTPEQQFQQGFVAYEKQDYQTAFRLWQPLAEQGDAKAQVMLGGLYLFGWGVQEDISKAKMWIGLACDNGLQEACDFYRTLNEVK
ncbi:tetratricopeptide repeat protein [Ursidibacter sp. B-7004-1]